jgi:hypothetical protein
VIIRCALIQEVAIIKKFIIREKSLVEKKGVMSDLAGNNDSILSGFLLIKSSNGFNIKQNPKKVS